MKAIILARVSTEEIKNCPYGAFLFLEVTTQFERSPD
jgi:hypothetical protein